MKIVALGVFALAMAFALETPAGATSITGSVAIGSGGVNTYTATSAKFNSPGYVEGATGSLSIMAANMADESTTLFNIGNFATEGGHELFDWNHLGTDITFTVLTLTVVLDNSQFLNVTGTGTLTETGKSPTPYLFSLTGTRSGDGTTGFTLDAMPPAATPEPGSLFLVGTGLLCLAGFLFRKAKKPAATSRC